jgi:3-phosphoshikimate 1-carboxyvinyltransferase
MISISKVDNDCFGNIVLPGSKSISNRLLMLQFRYGQALRIKNLSDADDTLLLSSMLDLVIQYVHRGEQGLLRIDTRNAGTVMRFLVPLLAVTRGHYLLTGSDRMKQRPVGDLVDAMRDMGASIEYAENTGFPPLLIKGRTIFGQRISVDASVSSQFVTALLLMAPTLESGLTIELKGTPVSSPYIKMTTGLLEELGIQVIMQQDAIRVYPMASVRTEVTVEADWSAAAFWYAMVSMAENGEVFFPGLKKSGLQGDQHVADLFRGLGVETTEEIHGIRIVKAGNQATNFIADFSAYPDLALPVILACAALGMDSVFTGLERLRIKESDRIAAITGGLKKAGVALYEESPGIWRVKGNMADPCDLYPDDFNDHRVAMTMASLAVKGFTVHLPNPDAVNKSYPRFWNDLRTAGFTCNLSC